VVKRTWVGPCARPEEDLDGAPDRRHSPSRAVYCVLTARGRARSLPARRMVASGVIHAPRRAAGGEGADRLHRPAARWAGRKAAVGAAARVSLANTRSERLECEWAHFRGPRAPSSGRAQGPTQVRLTLHPACTSRWPRAASAPRRSVGATPRAREAARRVGRVEKIQWGAVQPSGRSMRSKAPLEGGALLAFETF